LAVADYFFFDDAEFHVLDFNSHQIEKDLAENAVFQMEFAEIEFEFNVQTLFDAHLHFDWPILVRL